MLNPIEEQKFAELKDKCRDLRVPPPPDLFIGLQVHDESGLIVFDDVQRGHSWTRNYWNQAARFSAASAAGTATWGAGFLSAKAVTAYVYTAPQTYFANSVGTLGAALGIILGTGDTAFSVEQYAMAVGIAHGTGAGQMSYQTQSAWTSAYTAGTKMWKMTSSRIFNNNSGGSITVKETAITSLASGYDAHMWERSVLAPTVTVATGGQLTVTYEISMDFSAID